MKNYAVLSIMRSGHHAIIEWIINLSNFGFLFHNNYLYENNISILGNKKNKPYSRIINFEDISVEQFAKELNTISLKYNQTFIPVIIVRNPFNTFASRWIHKSSYITVNDHIINLWVDHAAELLRETKLIDNAIGIYFDHWFQFGQYREKLTKLLGIQCSDKPHKKVSNFGGGSSFDGLKYKGIATSMNVLTRWNEVNDKLLKTIVLKHPECNHYLNKLEKSIVLTE
ncbi:MAG: hypothetical protein JW870_04115 [Candidatus Delongbacteria bacterium]|nr:hypothetical protein [Candidatus Delongbacteria bacterium]